MKNGTTDTGGDAVEREAGAASIGRDFLIALLPLENLSGTSAPLKEIAAALKSSLANNGIRLLDGDLLENFRKKYRMRYIGGISSQLSEAMQKEMGVDAVLITSLEAYNEQGPPQISLISRLVSCGSQPEIIWIDSVGLSGDEAQGFLDLGSIYEFQPLLEKAVGRLTDSLLSTSRRQPGDGSKTTSSADSLNEDYLPYDYFRSPTIETVRKYSIAVIPMLDLAVRKNAGRIVSLHYVRELFQSTDFIVVEPGVVREELLRIRAIMPQGPSLAVTDLIGSAGSLGVDLVLAGKVFDYQNSSRNPKVDFSVQVIDNKSREIVFGARTFSAGMNGVFFFNVGRIFTAHNLLAEMARVTVQLLVRPGPVERGWLNLFARLPSRGSGWESQGFQVAWTSNDPAKNLLF